MNKIAKTLAAAALAVAGLSAYADSVSRYTAFADDQPDFLYSAAAAGQPLMVAAHTEEGACRFKVSLVGLQQSKFRDASMTGRIEGGTCNGVPVHHGLVLASASGDQDKVVLDRTLTVIVFD